MAKRFYGGRRADSPPAARHGRPAPGSFRHREGRLWIYGVHPVLAALGNSERGVRRLLVTAEQAARLDSRLEAALAARSGGPKPEIVDRHTLDRLLRGSVHQGIAVEAEPLEEVFLGDLIIRADSRPDSLLIVLDQVTDPHNVGAILRSAAAFGADGVITTERHAPGETAVLAKAAAGALDLVPLARVGNLARALADLKEAGYRCIGLDNAAERGLDEVAVPARRALVLGAEGPGMRRLTRDSCDELARIPIASRAYSGGALESLNVSNAAAVALYALTRSRADDEKV